MKFTKEPKTQRDKWIRARAFQITRKDKRISYGRAITEATAEYMVRNRLNKS